jgi:hypothetical protein
MKSTLTKALGGHGGFAYLSTSTTGNLYVTDCTGGLDQSTAT